MRRTRPISVTALSASPRCEMRVVLESERSTPSLPKQPEAILGTIIHDALDKFGERGPDFILEQVRAAMAGERGIVPSDAHATGEYRLREAIPATRVSSRLAAARRIAQGICSSTGIRSDRHAHSGGQSQLVHPLSHGQWREVGITAPTLNLSGRADLLTPSAHDCCISEFKTGPAIDSTGKVRESYIDQMHLYLMLARQVGYGPRFRLEILAADGSFPIRIDETRVQKLEARLERITRSVPLNKSIDVTPFAQVGESCATCNYRAWCEPYLREMPRLWTERAAPFEIPRDIWGTVEGVHSALGVDGYCNVYLHDAAKRLSCIAGVPDRFLETTVRVGSNVGFFGVRSQSTGFGHPQNFVLGVPGNPRLGSHSAMVVAL
jgi:hypothetical protein